MNKVEKHIIKKSHKFYPLIKEMCHTSNNLYNHALFIIRQNFTKNKTKDGHRKYLNYYAMNRLLKKLNEVHYKKLPSQTSQQLLMALDRNWKSFFKAIKVWKQHPELFTGKPNIPNYRKKGGMNQLIFTNQQCKIKKDILHFPKLMQGFTIPTHHEIETLKQVRIIPNTYSFTIEIVYDDLKQPISPQDNGRYMGIDLGLDNLVAAASNCAPSFLINGKGLKAKNKYFNHKIAELQSALERCQKRKKHSKQLDQLWQKRKNSMNDYFHKASRAIVTYCKKHQISKVIIGHNKLQKQESKLKNFVQIPIFSLIRLLKYKLNSAGIELIETEESYTSGTSFLDGEPPIEEYYNKNRRVNRGLFKTNTGRLINADINGAYQILKKVICDVEIPADNGFMFNPIQLDI